MRNTTWWMTIHHILNLRSEEWETEKERLMEMGNVADVVYLTLNERTFEFLVTQLIQRLRNDVDVVCFVENTSLEERERKEVYTKQREWLQYLTDLQKGRRIGRIVCTAITNEYKTWQEETPFKQRVDFFFHHPCEITSFNTKKIPLDSKKHFFITYHRWYNPQITALNGKFPIIIVENAGQFPTKAYVELINQSFCFIHTSPVGGLRSLYAAINLQTPTIVFLTQHPYQPGIDVTRESYLVYNLNLICPNEWQHYLKVFTTYQDLVAFLNRLLFARKQNATEEMETILSNQNKWAKLNEEAMNPYILWEKWLDTFGYPLPAELTPIYHILPSYLGDSPEVYSNLYPSGPWDNANFSLNYPNLQAKLRNRSRGE